MSKSDYIIGIKIKPDENVERFTNHLCRNCFFYQKKMDGSMICRKYEQNNVNEKSTCASWQQR